MSAIAGIYNFHKEPVSDEVVRNLMLELQCYPADDTGVWRGEDVFLGCHVQRVTPESRYETLPHGDQNDAVIASDAIIDNRNELFDLLDVHPTLRSAMPDSTLLLLAYRKWGKDAVRYIIGDFAFVIWDARERILFGARDLLGNRSLYYHKNSRQFAFCTAIRPLLTLPDVPKQLNEPWLGEFLAIPIILDSVDVHTTVYKHIQQLPPAHTFTVREGIVVLEKYASLTSPVEKLRLRSDGEYEEAFRSVFQEAVTSKLRTCREVGASLSGGLDSGAVAGFAANPLRSAGKTLHTYSYVPPSDFKDWTASNRIADESEYIKSTVEHVGNISARYLSFSERNSFTEIDEWLRLLEGPYKFFENSFWMRGIFERAKQDGVGVLLTGARGNHTISWGPALDYYALLLKQFRWVRFFREFKLFSRRIGVGRSRLLPIVARYACPILDRWTSPGHDPGVHSLIHPEFARRAGVYEKLAPYDVGLKESSVDAFEAREDQFRNLAISNLQGTSGTKLSLRYGIWERDPTADPRVIRFCLSLPLEQYVQNGVDRSLVRRATEHVLPDRVRMNQRIRGVQGADWMHRMIPSWQIFCQELRKLCQDSRASQFLNVKQVKESLSKVGSAPRPEHAYDPDARFLMRSLIVYRFIRQF